MPHVATDGSPLHERLIYLTYGTTYLPALCDASGNIVAVLGAGQVIEVTQDTAADLKATVNVAADQNIQARDYGYLSAAWYKQPLQVGVSAALGDVKSNTSLPAGNSNQFNTTVPASTLWHVTHASFLYSGTLPTQILLKASVGGVSYGINSWLKAALASGVTYGYHLDLWLAAGDSMFWFIEGATLNDDFYGSLLGHTMLLES